jgi:7-keto-8-aminopelargonate synthetase-like enzyme
VRIAVGLRDAGFHVDPIVFPAITPSQSRLRFMMNAHHTREHIDGVTEALARSMGV